MKGWKSVLHRFPQDGNLLSEHFSRCGTQVYLNCRWDDGCCDETGAVTGPRGAAAALLCFTREMLPFVGKSDSNQFDHNEDDDGDKEAGGDDDDDDDEDEDEDDDDDDDEEEEEEEDVDDDDDDDDDDDGDDDLRGLVCTCVDTVYVSRVIFVWCYVFHTVPSSGVPFVWYHLVSHPMVISDKCALRLLNTNWTCHPFIPQTKWTRVAGFPKNIHTHVLYVDMHICLDLWFYLHL